jgi:hypothetical protein
MKKPVQTKIAQPENAGFGKSPAPERRRYSPPIALSAVVSSPEPSPPYQELTAIPGKKKM